MRGRVQIFRVKLFEKDIPMLMFLKWWSADRCQSSDLWSPVLEILICSGIFMGWGFYGFKPLPNECNDDFYVVGLLTAALL